MNWYSFQAGRDSASISIYDKIGKDIFDEGVTAKGFIDELKLLGDIKDITLNINSPGGSVFEGIAIYNALLNHPADITVRIDGLAASIASVIAMVGDRIIMPQNSMLMIHDPFGVAMGGAHKMRTMADTLEKIKSSMVTAYQNKCDLTRIKIEDMMSKETWLSAAESKEYGFADEVVDSVKIAAEFDLSAYASVPSNYSDVDSVDSVWRNDAGIRKEFNDNYVSFKAYMRAEEKGNVRIKTSSGVFKGIKGEYHV